jgi:hypothetical protein
LTPRSQLIAALLPAFVDDVVGLSGCFEQQDSHFGGLFLERLPLMQELLHRLDEASNEGRRDEACANNTLMIATRCRKRGPR